MLYLEPEGIYHVYNHAVGEENLFRSAENFRYFLDRYQYYLSPVVETYAYCLLPNHFHLLIRVRSRQELIVNLNLQGFQNLEGFSPLYPCRSFATNSSNCTPARMSS